MAISKGKKINIIVSSVLLAIFLYLAYRNANLSELLNILKTTNYLYVILGSSIGVVLGSIIRSLRWGVLMHPIKKNIPFRSLLSATFIGYMVNNLIPRSGEIVRPYLIGKNENISRAAAFGTIIIERIIDTVTFLIMFGISLIFFKNRISNALPEIDFAVITLLILTFLLLFWIIFTMIKTELSLRIIKFFTKFLPLKYSQKIEKIFNSLVNGFNVLKSPALFFKVAVYSVIIWFVYLTSTYIPFYSFGIMADINIWQSLWNANLLLVLINVSMFVPAPAATGPYHYVCKVTLVNIFFINEGKALGYATASHIMAFLLYSIFGLYYFIRSHYSLKELKQETI
jgi:glycosyltransferase 2 family protein